MASNHLPLAIRWPAGIAAPGRVIDDHVSFIDLAPTFLEVAGVEPAESGMQPIQGRSLLELFRSTESGRVVDARDHVLIGKERHDVGRPGDGGYPIRGIVTEDWLYLRNFEPERWPGGNPETGYLNCDGGPTKTAVLRSRQGPATRRFWELSFGRRPAEELYDLADDPDCLRNLADDPAHRERKHQLSERLALELRAQQDPRILGQGEVFDAYPYADERHRGFYERYLAGEQLQAGWVRPSDFEDVPEDGSGD
jgi:arylsulfatase A-like enzyme